MAIRTITRDNLAAFAAERMAKGSQLTQIAGAPPAPGPAPGVGAQSGILGAGAETLATAPPAPPAAASTPPAYVGAPKGAPPAGAAPAASEAAPAVPAATAPATPEESSEEGEGGAPGKPRRSVQARIDELTRQKHELEELWQADYEARIRTEEQLKLLQAQMTARNPQPEAPKEPEDPKPVWKEGDDVNAYWEKRDAWNRREAVREFKKENEEAQRKASEERARELAAREATEAQARLKASLEASRATYTDFDEVLRTADQDAALQKIPAPPPHVVETLTASDYPAQIMYHFATHPEEARKIFELSPRRAALALGRLETRFRKEEAAAPAQSPATASAAPSAAAPPATATPQVPNISRAPAPMPSLAGGGSDIIVDPAQARNFSEYKRLRQEEKRRGGSRRA